ncbi:heme ABC exporter ATP-binding protein CcmA [Sphingomicrobium lutaoense]|uniref:Heme exporter protein A n=1 Tax=Sphingomicrobium lutaoense TaxID=515949 RepID=A0A839Z2X6_9SPHN|nr:heme ABC exporter ATP-binding protein CcmA [Sphingomicrobium lutaoense]MBB3764970.1 heme exporter protein A [Sphingomicrobium lutaoense]
MLLELSDVSCRRGGRLLFEHHDLALAAGDAVHLTGPNGVGKSSLLRLAAGLLAPAAGSIRRADAALADDRLALDMEKPLGEALAFWARIDGISPDAAMEAMGLAPLADVPVRFLSTGQAQRARLARVIASGAPLWLLDEPLNALDKDGRDRLGRAIAAHREKGGAVLAASHVSLGEDWREARL